MPRQLNAVLMGTDSGLDPPAPVQRISGEMRKADLLDAALNVFAEKGYDGASLRAIAAQAGVDAALVVHFFGSKAGLLTASVQWPFDPAAEIARVLAAGRPHAGEALARLFVSTWDELGRRNPILTLLRSATTEPAAAALMREFLSRLFLEPLAARLGDDRPALRADLVAAQLVGLGIARYVLAFEPLAGAPAGDVVAWVGPTLQRYLTGELPEG
jgi:AcrR family transcriptional regulator